MKKTITIIICLTLAIPVLIAQEKSKSSNEFKTLFGDKRVTHGGYGALSFNYSQIDDKDAILMGARGAWVIGHSFALGVGGYGFLNDYQSINIRGADRNVNLSGGYGGLLLEPIIFGRFPVHLSIPVLIGAGGVALTSTWNPYPSEFESFDLLVEDAAGYVVVEPGVELEFNVVRFFRLALGGYYRYTSRIDLDYSPTDVLNGWSAGVTLKFGKF